MHCATVDISQTPELVEYSIRQIARPVLTGYFGLFDFDIDYSGIPFLRVLKVREVTFRKGDHFTWILNKKPSPVS